MYRKVGMIVASVLLKVAGTKIQALIVFVVVLAFLVITANKRPFITRELNNLEIYSLVSSGISIYSGIFFLSSIESSYSHFDPSKDCKNYLIASRFDSIRLTIRQWKMVIFLDYHYLKYFLFPFMVDRVPRGN